MSWLSGIEFLNNRRERVLVALSGIAPDLDGLGIIIDKIAGNTNYYFQYHHYFGHSIFSAVALATIASLLAKAQRMTVWYLSFIVIHLHIICDITGSKGADGYQWPIYYLFPIFPEYGITWKYQWELSAWKNITILVSLFVLSAYLCRR